MKLTTGLVGSPCSVSHSAASSSACPVRKVDVSGPKRQRVSLICSNLAEEEKGSGIVQYSKYINSCLYHDFSLGKEGKHQVTM